MVLELIHGSLVGSSAYPIFLHCDENCDDDSESDSQDNPIVAGIVKRLSRCERKLLDEKQYIT